MTGSTSGTAPAGTRRRWPAALAVALGAVVALAGAGLLFLDSALTARAREQAARLSRDLGRPVEVGSVATKVLAGLGVRASDVRVGPGPGEEVPLLELRRVEVKAGLLRALLSGGRDVAVRSAEVEGLRLNVVRFPDGTTNVERLQKAMAEAGAREPAPPKPAPEIAPETAAGGGPRDLSFLRVDRAALVDARIALLDRSRPGAHELFIDHLDVTATDLRAGGPLDVRVKAAVLAEKQNLELRLHAAPLPPTLRPAFETVTLRVEPVDLAPLAPFVPAAVGLRGGRFEASLDASLGSAVAGGSGPTRLTGGFQASGLAFEGGEPLDAVLDADLEGDAEKGDLSVRRLRLDLGPAGLSGRGRVSGLAGPSPRIEGLEIVSHDLDPARLAGHYPPLRRRLGGRIAGPVGLSLRASGTEAQQALELRLDLTPVRLDLPGTLAKAAGARMTFVARLRGAAAAGGAMRFDVGADLSGVDLRPGGQLAKAPGERLSLSLAGTRRATRGEQALEITSAELALPGDSATAKASVTSGGSPGKETTRFRAQVESARLDLDRLLLPEAKKAPGEEGKAGKAERRREEKALAPAAFAGLSGEVSVHLGLLRLRKVDARDVRLLLRVEGDEVVVEKGEAAAFGGSLSAAGTRMRLAHAREPFQAKLAARGVELEQALLPFSNRKIVSGAFDGEVDLRGGGREKADLARTLAGLLSGKIVGGTFHGKDLLAGVAGPLARALPFGLAPKEGKGGGTSLGKEQPFELELRDGVARLKKPIRVARPEADIEISGGFRLDGTLDMPTRVALAPQTIASLTGGRARPSAAIPVSFRLTGPAWSPSLSGMDLKPAVSAIVQEAGAAALGKALGAPAGKSPASPQDLKKAAQEEAKKRLKGLFGQ